VLFSTLDDSGSSIKPETELQAHYISLFHQPAAVL